MLWIALNGAKIQFRKKEHLENEDWACLDIWYYRILFYYK